MGSKIHTVIWIWAIISSLFPASVMAQDTDSASVIKRNTIYVEAYGQGLTYSINGDRLFRIDKKIKTSVTAGITLVPASDVFILATPVSYNWVFGQRKSHLELGVGFTPMYLRESNIDAGRGYRDENGLYQYERFKGHENNLYTYFSPKIGYRYQIPEGGLFFRCNLMPHIAGINRYGGVRGKSKDQKTAGNDAYTEYFSSVALYGNRILLRMGFSVGWTLK